MARPTRFEQVTLWFEAKCSIQLSYGRVAEWINVSNEGVSMKGLEEAQRFWVGVAAREHVLRGVEGGFVQFGHGKLAPPKRRA